MARNTGNAMIIVYACEQVCIHVCVHAHMHNIEEKFICVGSVSAVVLHY